MPRLPVIRNVSRQSSVSTESFLLSIFEKTRISVETCGILDRARAPAMSVCVKGNLIESYLTVGRRSSESFARENDSSSL